MGTVSQTKSVRVLFWVSFLCLSAQTARFVLEAREGSKPGLIMLAVSLIGLTALARLGFGKNAWFSSEQTRQRAAEKGKTS